MRPLFAALLALALLAGPSFGACGDCCPPPSVPTSVSAIASCCGDCGTTVSRATDPGSLVVAVGVADPGNVAPASVIFAVPPSSVSTAVCQGDGANVSPPLSPTRPLRL